MRKKVRFEICQRESCEHDEIVYVPFSKAIKNDKPIKRDLVTVLKELSI